MAKILIVDDEDVLVELLSALVEDMGHEPLRALNGREALAVLAHQPAAPSLVITDTMMPQMDGKALIQALKNDPQFAHIPIIMTSAAGQPKGELLADLFVHKPFDLDDLATIIERYVNGYSDSHGSA